MSVVAGPEAFVTIRANEWIPSWLEGSEITPPAKAAVRADLPGQERRPDRRVMGDPFLFDAIGATSYLSSGQQQAIRTVMASGSVVESHKAVVLAALQVTSELYESKAALAEITKSIDGLSEVVRPLLELFRSMNNDCCTSFSTSNFRYFGTSALSRSRQKA